MNSIDIFPWDDNFNTGLSLVDEQHRQLVRLLNELAGHVAFKSDEPILDRLFDELADYAVYHFESEEAIWREFLGGDAAELQHRQTHASFIQEVIRMRQSMGTRQLEDVAEEALGFLARWLAAHILESDRYMAYTVLARREGLAVEAAKLRAREQMGGATRALIDIILSIYATLSNNTLRLMRELAEHRQAQSSLVDAKRALEESQSLLRTIVDTVPMRIFWKDRDLNYLGCNPVFARDAGKETPAEMVGPERLPDGLGAPGGGLPRRRLAGDRVGGRQVGLRGAPDHAPGRHPLVAFLQGAPAGTRRRDHRRAGYLRRHYRTQGEHGGPPGERGKTSFGPERGQSGVVRRGPAQRGGDRQPELPGHDRLRGGALRHQHGKLVEPCSPG